MQKNKRTKEEMKAWCNLQRRLYSKGLLSKEKIAKLEKIPNWSWTPTK